MCSLQGCVLNPLLLAFTPMTATRAIPVTPSSNFKWHHGHCTHQQKGMSLPTEKKSWKCQPEVQQTTSHWREKKSSLTSGRTAKPRPLATSIAIIWRGFKPSNSWVPSPPLTYPGLWPQRHYIGTAVTSLPECSGRTSWVESCWWPFTADILHHSVRSSAKTEKRECVIINTPAISGLCNIPEKCNTPLMSNIDLILLETPCSVVYYW